MTWKRISMEPIPATPVTSLGIGKPPKTYDKSRVCPALRSDGSVCGTLLRATNPGPNCDTHTERTFSDLDDEIKKTRPKKTSPKNTKRPRTPTFSEMFAEIQKQNQDSGETTSV